MFSPGITPEPPPFFEFFPKKSLTKIIKKEIFNATHPHPDYPHFTGLPADK